MSKYTPINFIAIDNYPFKKGVVFSFSTKYGKFRLMHSLRVTNSPLCDRITLIRYNQKINLYLLFTVIRMSMTQLVTSIVNTDKIKNECYKILYSDIVTVNRVKSMDLILTETYETFLNELSL